jgi:nitrogen fixation NifU-like protein
MIKDIYKEKILDHYKNPRNYRKMKNAQTVIHVKNPSCGDEINLYIFFEGGKVKDVSFKSAGCVISTAATSMMTEKIKGMSIKELKKLDEKVILKMLRIPISPVRMKCALLPLEALKKLTKNLEK